MTLHSQFGIIGLTPDPDSSSGNGRLFCIFDGRSVLAEFVLGVGLSTWMLN